ncbi:MAG: protein-L-isoaspartate O-methyltransferase [Alphaproteobacteria bacterium]|nr:protein-L-isoaspartate O-methyltransferase [Alphaproteobacteria bacterium]
MSDYTIARQHMVECQIRTNKVNDPAIVEALTKVPRENFVPESMRSIAYVDEDIAIDRDRYLMEPMVLARLLQEMSPEASEIALVVGGATGYSAAVLADICTTVVVLESDPALARKANDALVALGIDNAVVVEGPLTDGCPAQGPFGVILFDGAVDEVPAVYFDQLGENGRAAAVISDGGGGVGRATLFLKEAGRIWHRTVFDAAIHLLPGFRKPASFTF